MYLTIRKLTEINSIPTFPTFFKEGERKIWISQVELVFPGFLIFANCLLRIVIWQNGTITDSTQTNTLLNKPWTDKTLQTTNAKYSQHKKYEPSTLQTQC